MSLVRAASLSRLQPGSVTEIEIAGALYAVCNAGGEVYALAGVCPHRGGPLGHGALHENWLVCPWHAWEFDCRTGTNDYDPAVKVPTVPVRVRGDDIYLDLA